MKQSQYQVGIVRGLENLQDVLEILYKREDKLFGYKYHGRQGIVCFSANGGTNIAKVVQELQEIGLRTVKVSS